MTQLDAGLAWLDRKIKAGGPGSYAVVARTNLSLRTVVLPAFLARFHPSIGSYNHADRRFAFTEPPDVQVVFVTQAMPAECLAGMSLKAAWLHDPGPHTERSADFMSHLQRALILENGDLQVTDASLV